MGLITTWLGRLTRWQPISFRKRPTHHRAIHQRRALCEPLEDRRLLTAVWINDDYFAESGNDISGNDVYEYLFDANAGDVIGIDVRSGGNDVDLATVVRFANSGSGRIASTPDTTYDDMPEFLLYTEDLEDFVGQSSDARDLLKDLLGTPHQLIDPIPLLFYAPETNQYRITIQVDPKATGWLAGGKFDISVRKDGFSGAEPVDVYLELHEPSDAGGVFQQYWYGYTWGDGTSWTESLSYNSYDFEELWWENDDDMIRSYYDEVFGSGSSDGRSVANMSLELREVFLLGEKSNGGDFNGLVDYLQQLFGDYDVNFTTTQPAGGDHIHVHIGTNRISAAQNRSPGNQGHNDVLIYSEPRDNTPDSFADSIISMAGSTAHEIGHSLGLGHATNASNDNIMNYGERSSFSDDAQYAQGGHRLEDVWWGLEGVWGTQKADTILRTILGESVFHTITVSSGAHGDIVDLSGTEITSIQVPDGESDIVYASPDSGYVVDRWYLDSQHQPAWDGLPNFALTNVQSSHSVFVTFEQQKHSDITVLAPAAGSRYASGTTMYIGWDSGTLEGNVSIELYRGASSVDEIEDSVSASHSRDSYDIPDDRDVGDDYRVKITFLEDPSINSFSDYFSIVDVDLGNGPIPIDSLDELKMIGSGETIDVGVNEYWFSNTAHYELVADIDVNNNLFTPLGQANDGFQGTLDGQGHKIIDLRIEPDGKENKENVGLFWRTGDEAVIKNLTIERGSIRGDRAVGAIAGAFAGLIVNVHSSANVEGNRNIGGLVGENKGIIRNSSTYERPGGNHSRVKGDSVVGGIAGDNQQDGVIEWTSSTLYLVEGRQNVGGIVGVNQGTVRESYTSLSNFTKGDTYTGGIVGRNSGATVTDSYSTTRVEGDRETPENVGGVAGQNSDGTITRSYAAGNVESGGGGLVGKHTGSLEDSFWDTATTGAPPDQPVGWGGGAITNSHGKTTAEMRQQSTFASAGWDFENVWTIDEGQGYPQLRGARPSLIENPGSVNATDGLPGIVSVSWSSVAEAGYYGVYRSDSADGIRNLLAYVSGTSYEDVNGLPNETYHYAVTAAYTNAGAGESEIGNADIDEGFRVFQADAPDNLLASTDLLGTVFVEWDEVAGADYYRVYRSEAEGGTKVAQTDWVDTASYFDSATVTGQDYYYWVRASADATGESQSEYSDYAIGREGIPNPPNAVADGYTVAEDGTLSIDATGGVLANDSDADGDPLTALRRDDVEHGSLELNTDGSFTYEPNADFFGTDTFTYRTSDGELDSIEQTVTIMVTPVNDPPTAADDEFEVAMDSQDNLLDPLSNDSSDPDSDETLTITTVSAGSQGGMFTIVENNTKLEYTPVEEFWGTEIFTYTVSDGNGGSANAMAEVTVPEPPPNTIGGFVFVDVNDDGIMDEGELPVSGYTVTLTGVTDDGTGVEETVISDKDGFYKFTDLARGTYELTETQPAALLDGRDTVGSLGGDMSNDHFYNVDLAGGQNGIGYNFGEIGLRPEMITLQMFLASSPPMSEQLPRLLALGEEWFGDDDNEPAEPAPPAAAGDVSAVDESQVPTVDPVTEGGPDSAGQPTAEGASASLPAWRNGAKPLDVDGDGHVSSLDMLLIINDMKRYGARPLGEPSGPVESFLDTNGDGYLTPIDALLVNNYLNALAEPVAHGEGEPAEREGVLDAVFAELGDRTVGRHDGVGRPAPSVLQKRTPAIDNLMAARTGQPAVDSLWPSVTLGKLRRRLSRG